MKEQLDEQQNSKARRIKEKEKEKGAHACVHC